MIHYQLPDAPVPWLYRKIVVCYSFLVGHLHLGSGPVRTMGLINECNMIVRKYVNVKNLHWPRQCTGMSMILTAALATETPILIPSSMPSVFHSSSVCPASRDVLDFHDHNPYKNPAAKESPAPVGSTDFVTMGFCLLRILLLLKATEPFSPLVTIVLVVGCCRPKYSAHSRCSRLNLFIL